MLIPELYELFRQSAGVTTDTRKISQGQLFFALKGDQFNGNAFAVKALQAGAAYAIIDEEEYKADERCILVVDVLQTLQQLAHHHRKIIQPKVVLAVTGSNGKTTTKELLYAVLSTTFSTHCTKGNLNNHIGIPLTLLEMPEGTEIAVIEMGANHQQEIAAYCLYTEPTHGVITNCGKAHLEGFGGVEGIRKGKGELYDYLNTHKGTVIVNGDDKILLDMLRERGMDNFVAYGEHDTNTFKSRILQEQPYLEISFEEVLIHSNLFGRYNFSNIMCAVAAGKYFGVKNTDIKNAIENYKPRNARSELVERNGYHLILDSYNANPTSMQHALESFAQSGAAKKVLILGDMFELGAESAKEHQFIADLCQRLRFDTVVLVGNDFFATQSPSGFLKFLTTEDARQWFRQQDFSGAHILLKGSRGMAMEKVLD